MEKIINEAFESYYSREQKYYNVNKYNKPCVYNNGNNHIKSYNVSINTINNLKSLYPIYQSSQYYSPIANSVNCYLLKVYITQTIIDYKLFTSPKKLTAYCDSIHARVKGFTCYHIFLIPEQNYDFTGKQIMRFVTLNK